MLDAFCGQTATWSRPCAAWHAADDPSGGSQASPDLTPAAQLPPRPRAAPLPCASPAVSFLPSAAAWRGHWWAQMAEVCSSPTPVTAGEGPSALLLGPLRSVCTKPSPPATPPFKEGAGFWSLTGPACTSGRSPTSEPSSGAAPHRPPALCAPLDTCASLSPTSAPPPRPLARSGQTCTQRGAGARPAAVSCGIAPPACSHPI